MDLSLTNANALVAGLIAGRRVWAMFFVAAFATILFLPGFFSLPPIDRDETRFAQASRQMVETGDYVDIRLGEGTRYKKPVGIYWLQSLSLKLAGGEHSHSIWVYRLPSLISAVAACVLTYLIALTLMNGQVALVAALLMATCFVLGAEARLAKSDSALLASILMAQLVLARAQVDRLHKGWMHWVFWVALSASVLIKGPIGPMVVGLTTVALCVVRRETRWLRQLRPVSGAALFLVLVVPWFIAISVASDGAFWADSLGDDLIAKIGEGQENHGAPFGTFSLAVWLTFWPAAIFLPFGMWYAWRQRHDRAVQFCLAWLVPSWLVFEIATTKLVHYVLPTYPALAILCAAGWMARPLGPLSLAYRIFLAVFLGLALLLAAVPLGFSLQKGIGPSHVWLLGLIITIVSIWWTWTYMRRDRRLRVLLGVGGLSLGLGFSVYGHLAQVDYLWPSNTMAEIYQSVELCEDPILVALGYQEESLMLLTDHLPVFTFDAAAAAQSVKDAECALAFVDAPYQPAFQAALGARSHAVLDQFKALSLGGNDRLNMTAYLFHKGG